MAKESVETLVDGGKATAGPPLGPALGPLGVNMGQVIKDINEKTADFKGMKVPVTVEVNTETKEYKISIGTPPASALIKKEAGIETASSNPLTDLVADLKIEQVIKVALMKKDSLLGKDNFMRCREILGTCQSMGVMVEGKRASETLKELEKYREKIETGKTELTAEELKALEIEKKRLQKELEEKKADYVSKANELLKAHEGKEIRLKRKALQEAGIPQHIIDEVCPEEKLEKKA